MYLLYRFSYCYSRNWTTKKFWNYCISPTLIRPLLQSHSNMATPSAMKRWSYKRGGLSWGDNLVVFYNLNAVAIWLAKRGGLWWEWSYRKGICTNNFDISFTSCPCVCGTLINWSISSFTCLENSNPQPTYN